MYNGVKTGFYNFIMAQVYTLKISQTFLVTLHICKNTQKRLFCQTTNSVELALGMQNVSCNALYFSEKYFLPKTCT